MCKNVIVFIFLIMLFLSFSGCINDESDDESKNNSSEKYFSLWYSTDSDVEEEMSIIIVVNESEIYNNTITPKKGSMIYEEKIHGDYYNITVSWKDIISKKALKPDGEKNYFIVIKNGKIDFSESED